MSLFGRDRYGNSLTGVDVLTCFDVPDPKCPECRGSGVTASAGCTSLIYYKCMCVRDHKEVEQPKETP